VTSLIGCSTTRSDAEAKVRGEAAYGVDFSLPGTLHAKLLRSPSAAGRILRLDVSKARQVAGVVAVVTAADAPTHRSGLVLYDVRLFAVDSVVYEGEPVAAVVAETQAQAEEALQSIVLEIEEQPPISSISDALARNARLVHDEWDDFDAEVDIAGRRGNVVAEMTCDLGDIEAAFEQAALVVEDEFETQRQYQACLEPKSASAVYEAGRYTIHVSHQFPFLVRKRVAHALGVGLSRVRVTGHYIGGGFGSRLDLGFEAHAALLARLVGRPVKLIADRTEDLITCASRENALIRIRTALSDSGEILARDLSCDLDSGASAGDAPLLVSIPLFMAGGIYSARTQRVVGRAVYTNTAPTGAFRGVSGTYLVFAMERHMDRIADALGRDRRQFRLDNLLQDGESMLNGQILHDAGILREGFERLEASVPWATLGKGEFRGVGMACHVWLTNPQPGSATLAVNEDGTAALVTAATDNGSGAVTMALRQIAAEELGLRPEDIVVSMPDTDLAAYDAGSQGSRTTHVVGRAIIKAAETVKARLFEAAAAELEASEADMELFDASVRVVGDPSTAIPLGEAVQLAQSSYGPVAATGSYVTPPIVHDEDRATGLLLSTFPTPTYHLHVAEVEVDPDTGAVTVVRYIVVQEVGTAINPAGIRGQIQGGVAQGIGYALYESLELDHGRYVQRTLEAYGLPVAPDVPDVEIILMEHPDGAGPYGAKGVGEPPIVPVAAAIANAVADATGAAITRLPITSARVLDAIDQRRVMHSETETRTGEPIKGDL